MPSQAFERFTPEGPAALLPKGDRYALVWTASNADAAAHRRPAGREFLAALYRHFGGRQGLFLNASPRKTFPLKLAWTGSEAADRVVRIGNAAQTLHPVAGQGFNIGLRDAWELASLCGDTPASEIGSAAMLRRLRARTARRRARRRRLHRFPGARVLQRHRACCATRADSACWRWKCLPPLKTFVARRMMFGARG